jgi:uncharacterized membrane protein
MDLYQAGVDLLRMSLLLVGSLVVFIGVARAVAGALRLGPGPHIPQRILDHTALGLEFFIGAGLLSLTLNPTWAAVMTAALIIAVRKLITLSLGQLAWGS